MTQYRVEITSVGYSTVDKPPRYYVVKTDGTGKSFKERISKERYRGFYSQAARIECAWTKMKKDGERYESARTFVFDHVPTLFG